MLDFQNKPDRVFTEIVTHALEEAIEALQDTSKYDMIQDEDVLKAFGTTEFLKTVLEKLLEAHKSPDLYIPTDWHFLLLDRILSSWCERYLMEKPYVIKDYKGETIPSFEFEAIMDTFFWDDDYDFDPEVAREMQGTDIQQNMEVSDVAINASLRRTVDYQDVALEKCDGEPELEEEDEELGEWWKNHHEEDNEPGEDEEEDDTEINELLNDIEQHNHFEDEEE